MVWFSSWYGRLAYFFLCNACFYLRSEIWVGKRRSRWGKRHSLQPPRCSPSPERRSVTGGRRSAPALGRSCCPARRSRCPARRSQGVTGRSHPSPRHSRGAKRRSAFGISVFDLAAVYERAVRNTWLISARCGRSNVCGLHRTYKLLLGCEYRQIVLRGSWC